MANTLEKPIYWQLPKFKIMKFEALLASVLLSGLSSAQQSSPKHDLKVEIENIKSSKGQVTIGVFNSANGFLVDGKQYKTKTVKLNGNTANFEFKDLPKGNYAVAVYHDKNSDKKFNTNMFGLPKEAYGFSTNFKPSLSKPKFSDIQFVLNDDKTIKIDLIN